MTDRRSFLTALTFVAALIAGLSFAKPAFADALDQAKAAGLVGEQRDGYVGFVVSSPPADIVRLVSDINLRRKAEYRRIAEQTAGANLGQVETLAGSKLIGNVPSGQYFEAGDGSWQMKP